MGRYKRSNKERKNIQMKHLESKARFWVLTTVTKKSYKVNAILIM
jgi:hypothetical protein